jgi:alpha-glucosidase
MSSSWDTATLEVYGSLARIRRSHAALRRGGQRWAYVDDDTIAFVREHSDGSVLVVARRAAGPSFALPLTIGSHLLGTEPDAPVLSEPGVVPASSGPRLDIWSV